LSRCLRQQWHAAFADLAKPYSLPGTGRFFKLKE
jgi:hypothetical protein